ncbi:hypothetical protein LS482_19035 [Sinomicrobium kalidii]|uniref:exo-alpha-sialidase n=1 Tax=Sinomicrobium kalidii TaxID=2900738 RepID=UPI001E4F13C7|nr:exo-alpha-sialidase [Sinomicrobium kalidii]UGU15763.1 hypothetical protein LS482_19035 [Sinomicrobium kalidii]
MNRPIYSLLLLLFLFSCTTGKDDEIYIFTSFREPATDGLYLAYSTDGYHWEDLGGPYLEPGVGKSGIMRDPSITQGPDGTYHMVWTTDWKGGSGFGYASSEDLVHWSEQKFIPVMEHEPETVNVWAPELFYDDEEDRFIIIWASTIPHRFEKGEEAEDNNHRMYYVTTKDFRSFSETKLFLDPGFSVIDAVIVKRKKDDYALVLKDNTRPMRNLKVAFGKSPLGPFENISEPFTGFLTEGPTVLKKDGKWLIYFDNYKDKNYGAVRTSDFRTFEGINDKISLPEGHKHGTISTVSAEVLETLKAKSREIRKAQDTVHYTGKTLSNIDYHHGQLSPAVGVHARQIMRASREHPETADSFGWTYNHAPNMAYWNNTYFVQYLSDPVSEHVPPGQTLLMTSENGKDWSKPEVLFPVYRIPDGWKKEGREGVAKNLDAVMHQRMGFYVASDGRLLTLAYYGIAMDEKDDPNDGKGIGRAVREIYKDGSFGPIYFIRYNKTWDQSKSEFPFYKESEDKGFVKACDELLSKPLMMQQWVEEADRDDPLIPLKKQFKAFSYYHLDDGRVVGLWKHALTSISKDGGKSWEYHPVRAPGFVNSNAKIWGQKTSDGRFATVYNPSEYRWPLGISTSDDGLTYKDLLLVHGEISTMRYGGNYKSYGPQYVRGILEGNGTPPGGDLWVTYSMNKEDIWVASVPVPVTGKVEKHANDVFDQLPDGEELKRWNIYDLVQAPVRIEKREGNKKWLALKDKDPFDYARAERVIPSTKKLKASFTVQPAQNHHGILQVEFQNRKGLPAVRLIFDRDGILKLKAGARFKKLLEYEAGKDYHIEIKLDVATRSYAMKINGEEKHTRIFYAPVSAFERIMFRTGEQRHFPTPDTPADNYDDLPATGKQIPEAAFYIGSLITEDYGRN